MHSARPANLLFDTHDTHDTQAQALVAKGVKQVVITLGSRGCLVVDKDSSHHVPAPKVKAVDTTGAGTRACHVSCRSACHESCRVSHVCVVLDKWDGWQAIALRAPCSISWRVDVRCVTHAPSPPKSQVRQHDKTRPHTHYTHYTHTRTRHLTTSEI